MALKKNPYSPKTFFVSLACAFCVLTAGANTAPDRGDLPASRFVNWQRAQINFPDATWDTVNVSTLGILPGNALGDSIGLKFVKALAAQGSKKVIYYFPAGTYLFERPICIGPSGVKSDWNVTGAEVNNVVLMGAGPSKTRLLFNCDVTYFKALIWVELPRGYSARNQEDELGYSPKAGDTSIILPSGVSAKVGDLIDIKSTNDSAIMFPPADSSSAWVKKYNNPLDTSEGIYPVAFAESYGQISEVTSVKGNTVTIDPPCGLTFKDSLKPRISMFAAKSRTENIGIQDLYIEHVVDSTHYSPMGQNDIFDIALRFVRNGYIKNVESYKTARGHAIVEYAHNVLVSGCKFSYARRYGVGGAGYGVCIQNRSSAVTVENCEFKHLRHAVVLKEGANHCVIGYNWTHNWAILDPAILDSTGHMIQAEADIANHGMYPHDNLFEGNVCFNITYSDYWGPTGPKTTSFRNRCYLDTGTGIRVHDFSANENVIANILPQAGAYMVDSSCVPVYNEGNVCAGVAKWNALTSSSKLPPSLYLFSAPAFWTPGLAWPAFGPDVASSATNPIPAMSRDSAGTPVRTIDRVYAQSIMYPVFRNGMLRGMLPGAAEISIVSCDGKTMRRFECNKGKYSIRLNTLVPGIYMVKIFGNGIETSGKMLVTDNR